MGIAFFSNLMLWTLLGAALVFLLVRRIADDALCGAVAALCFVLMPSVGLTVHVFTAILPATVLMLLAVVLAARYAEGGAAWIALSSATACALAIGWAPVVASVVLVLPGMVILRRQFRLTTTSGTAGRCLRDSLGWILVAFIIYGVLHLAGANGIRPHRAITHPNLFGPLTLAKPTLGGIYLGLRLITWGTSPLLAAVGAAGAVALGVRAGRVRSDTESERRRRANGLLLAAPSIAIGLAAVLFAGEGTGYANVALPFDVFLLVEGTVAVSTFVRNRFLQITCYLVLLLTTLLAAFAASRSG